MLSADDMKRFLLLWKEYIRIALIREMEFRMQFFVQVGISILWIGVLLLTNEIFFLHTNDIYGWEKNEVLLLVITSSLIMLVANTFFTQGMNRLSEVITTGHFDTILTKPFHSLWQLGMSRFNLPQLIEGIVQAVLFVLVFRSLHIEVSLLTAAVFFLLCMCGVIIAASMFIVLQSLCFWFTNLPELLYFYYSVVDFGRHPSVIFRAGQVVLFTAVPVAYIGNVQTLLLVGADVQPFVLWTLLATIGSALVAYTIYTIGSRKYASASS